MLDDDSSKYKMNDTLNSNWVMIAFEMTLSSVYSTLQKVDDAKRYVNSYKFIILLYTAFEF